MDTSRAAIPAADKITVRELVDAYLLLGRDEARSKERREDQERTLGHLVDAFGDMRVNDLRPVDLKLWIAQQKTWRTNSTKKYRVSILKRCFNWACEEMELTSTNPARKIKSARTTRADRRRPMTDEEFQSLMRSSPPYYRRFLMFLKMTGCRPGEARKMRWRDIRWEMSKVVLADHKTASATGLPRNIVLVPAILKMLRWMRQHRSISTVGLLERLLLSGPQPCKRVARMTAIYGISCHAVRRARITLGAKKRRVGGATGDGWLEYYLPDDHQPAKEGIAEGDFVFLNADNEPLRKQCLSNWIQRARKRLGLAKECTLYGLRHRFGVTAIKNGVNLKVLAILLGHVNTVMTEHYVDDEALGEDAHAGALVTVYGRGVFGRLLPAPPPPKPINLLPPPPAEELEQRFEHLPSRYKLGRPRPQVPVVDEPIEVLMNMLLEKAKRGENRRPSVWRSGTKRRPDVLPPAWEKAHLARQWAIGINQQLEKASDLLIFQWLLTRPDCPHAIPPNYSTFGRYVRGAKHHYDCVARRELKTARRPIVTSMMGGGA